jgi:hypothetical protein
MKTISRLTINLKKGMLIVLFLIRLAVSVNAQQNQTTHMETLKTSGYAPVNGLESIMKYTEPETYL